MEREYKHRTHPALRVLKFLGFIVLGALAAAAFAFVFGYLIMLLWNWLMPAIFGLTVITFWQAVGIAFLARLIFGAGKHGSDHSKNHSPRRPSMRNWKDEFKKHSKCGDWRHFDDYWCQEGEKAYGEFIDRKNEQEQK